jgi:hypothetical protein
MSAEIPVDWKKPPLPPLPPLQDKASRNRLQWIVARTETVSIKQLIAFHPAIRSVGAMVLGCGHSGSARLATDDAMRL